MKKNDLPAQMFHRSDWMMVARRFKEYPKLLIACSQGIVDASLTFDGFKKFFSQGCTTGNCSQKH
jgi:hypothetical protein